MNPKIIHEDDYIIVIDKPVGLVVNRAESVKGKTLQEWLEARFKIDDLRFKREENKEFINRSGIVHRLDKQTSGLMVIAKNPESFYNLQNQFKSRTVAKKYYALVHGKISPKAGNIRAPIKRNPRNPFRFAVIVGGRESETDYRLIDYYENEREKNPGFKFYSLAEVSPKTGRTHQIRVHFSHLKYPLVADDLYCGRKTLNKDSQWCPRLFLQAFYLEFTHPESKKRLNFKINLAKDLDLAIGKLSKIPEA